MRDLRRGWGCEGKEEKVGGFIKRREWWGHERQVWVVGTWGVGVCHTNLL